MKTVISFEGGQIGIWLLKEVMEPSSLELSKPQVDSPGKHAVAGPAWAGEFDKMISGGVCQPQLFSDSVIY